MDSDYKKQWQFLTFQAKSNMLTLNQLSDLFYKGELKVLQYFVNVWHNSSAPNAFVDIVQEMNLTGLWDANLV